MASTSPGCLPPPGPPVLVTLHLPPGWYRPGRSNPSGPRTWLHCVSRSQQHEPARRAPSCCRRSRTASRSRRWRRPAARGAASRSCWRGSAPRRASDLALEAAHARGVELLIGGEVFPYPAHTDYFASKVRPLLDGRRRFLGPVGFARKRRLLAAARCLLIPSLAPETSSLVGDGGRRFGHAGHRLPERRARRDRGAWAHRVPGRRVREMVPAIARAEEIDAENAAGSRGRASPSKTVTVCRYLGLTGPRGGFGVTELADIELITRRRRPGRARPGVGGALAPDALGHPFQSPAWLLDLVAPFGTGRPGSRSCAAAAVLRGCCRSICSWRAASGSCCRSASALPTTATHCEPGLPPASPDALFAPRSPRRSRTRDGLRTDRYSRRMRRLRGLHRPAGWRMARSDRPCPVLTGPATAPEPRPAIPARMLRKLRMNRHRADRAGGWRIQTATEATRLLAARRACAAARDALDLARRSRRARRSRAYAPFILKPHPRLLAMGVLRLQVLRIGHVIAAADPRPACRDGSPPFLSQRFRSRVRLPESGDDPAGAMIEQALPKDSRELHFLRGNEAYKYAWGGIDRTELAIRLTRLGSP